VISAVGFLVVGVGLCAAAVLAILGTAQVWLSGSEAIEHDGLERGRLAPRWSLTDQSGTGWQSPPRRALQLVLFADHSIKSFPSVLDGVRELSGDPDLEIVLLLRQPNDLAAPLLGLLGLGELPVLTGSPGLYARYNVRVGPFAVFVGTDGRVRASSLVNHDWQLAKLHALARLPAPELVAS
jgi:hypothetical protein